jgi:hypothetical protein
VLTRHTILDKCRIHRLRQFQGQDYLIGRMSALAISPCAAQAWLALDGVRSVGEIAQGLALRMDRPLDEVERGLLAFADDLHARGAAKAVGEAPTDLEPGAFTAEVVRLPAALLWGGFNS